MSVETFPNSISVPEVQRVFTATVNLCHVDMTMKNWRIFLRNKVLRWASDGFNLFTVLVETFDSILEMQSTFFLG